MKLQIILGKELSPIIFNQAKIIIIDSKKGLRVIGSEYKKVFPLEIITSIVVVEND